MRFIQSLGFAAAIALAGSLVASSAQAACDGGACPIVGGSQRTQVSRGLPFPIAALANGGSGPTGKVSYFNNAGGAVLPTPSAQATIGTGAHPRSIRVPDGQLTWGLPVPPTLSVQIFPINPALFSIKTKIANAWPNGGATFAAGGRTGPSTVTFCPGAPFPTASYNPGCLGANTTGLGGPTDFPGLMRYTKTANQFGGPATQRWPNFGPSRGGTIHLNVAGITALPCNGPGCVMGIIYPGNSTNQIWGGAFGLTTVMAPVSPTGFGVYTGSNGAAGTVFSIGNPTPPIASINPPFVQTATSIAGPFTTGRLEHSVPGLIPPEEFVLTGSDQRNAVTGDGYISMVSGNMANRSLSGPSTNRVWVSLQLGVPEPGMGLGLAASALFLACAGAQRRR